MRPECCTDHLLELLGFLDDLFRANAIRYWLDYGTLLGAVRDGRLIPWDGDADVSIYERDAERVLALREEIERPGYSIGPMKPEMLRLSYSKTNDNHVDIFFWRQQGGLLALAEQEDPEWYWPGMHERDAFPVSFVDPLGEVTLNGLSFPAPSPAHEFLREHRYGPDYLVPIRPISTIAIRPVFRAAEMPDGASALLARIGERDANLVHLAQSHSRLLRSGRWTLGHTRWMTLSGLPLKASRRTREAVHESHAPPGMSGEATETLLETLAWIETAIEEFEHPPRLIGLLRVYRRYRRIRNALLRRARRAAASTRESASSEPVERVSSL